MKDNKEKTYLTWANKIGYGSGDIAGNVVYALLSAFVMIFLTDTVGMNAGIVGTLIAVSRHQTINVRNVIYFLISSKRKYNVFHAKK